MMGYGYGYGMGVGGWIAMAVFWVGLFTLVIWGLSRAFPSHGGGGVDTAPRGRWPESAEEILDRRFASGELDEETYRSMLSALRSSRDSRNESG